MRRGTTSMDAWSTTEGATHLHHLPLLRWRNRGQMHAHSWLLLDFYAQSLLFQVLPVVFTIWSKIDLFFPSQWLTIPLKFFASSVYRSSKWLSVLSAWFHWCPSQLRAIFGLLLFHFGCSTVGVGRSFTVMHSKKYWANAFPFAGGLISQSSCRAAWLQAVDRHLSLVVINT